MNYENLVVSLPLDGGGNEGTDFRDLSLYNDTPSLHGGIEASSAQSQFYGSSAEFIRSSSKSLRLMGRSRFAANMATSKATIRFWAYPTFDTAGTQYLAFLGNRGNNNGRMQLQLSDDNNFNVFMQQSSNNAVSSADGAVSADTWQHFEVGLDEGTLYLFVDGVLVASGSTSFSFTTGSDLLVGEARASSTDQYFDGFMQDFEMFNGEVLHTTSFTPPPRRKGVINNSDTGVVKDDQGDPAERDIIVIPEIGATERARFFHGASDSSGEFEIECPAYPSWVIGRDPDGSFNDKILARVTPE